MMGLVYADIKLINSDDIAVAARKLMPESEIRRLDVRVLVDSGAYMLAINEAISDQL